MAAKSVSVQQFKQLQYKSQILQSYINKLQTTLRAYNASCQFSGDDQFLAIMRMKLQQIEQTILTSRVKEQELKLNNSLLSTQINKLKQERDSLKQSLKMEESKVNKMNVSSSSSSLLSNKSEKQDRRSQKNKGDCNERMIVETALHIIKGAIVRVMDIPTARTTMSVHFSDKPWIGSITIGNCDQGKLYKIDEKIKLQIEDMANDIINQNVECKIYKDLKRKEAEDRFGEEMYDYYPVPAKVEILSVLEIKDNDGKKWNVNCSNKTLCKRTGELIGLKVGKTKFNGKKKQLTVYFTVGPDAKA